MQNTNVYTLMHGDIPVADLEFENTWLSRIIHIHNLNHAPTGCITNDKLDIRKLRTWFDTRRIPNNRENLQDIIKKYNNKVTTDELALNNLYISMADAWWINPQDNPTTWPKIKPNKRCLLPHGPDPSYTLTGAVEKYWKRNILQTPKLIKIPKHGHEQQAACETASSKIGAAFNIDVVNYKQIITSDNRIATKCTPLCNDNEELILAKNILSERNIPGTRVDENMNYYIDRLNENGLNGAKAIQDMLVIDILVRNPDRRWDNFGIIRDATTLKWLRPAPIFDLGDGLWLDEKPNREEAKNKLNRHMLSDDTKFVRDILLEHTDIIEQIPFIVRNELRLANIKPEHALLLELACKKRCEIILGICEGCHIPFEESKDSTTE